jgi:hypothetical protein
MAVERSRWTDERLDDLAERVVRQDARGDKIDELGRTVEALRQEMIAMRSELVGDMSSLRSELVGDMSSLRSELRGEMNALRSELGGQITDMRREFYTTRWAVIGIWVALLAVFIEIALRT